MKLAVYGKQEDAQRLQEYLPEWKVEGFDTLEQLMVAVCQDTLNTVVVTMDNAAGMEGVIAVRQLRPELPVLWFSNDKDFGVQSYRLGASFFGVKPVQQDRLRMALSRNEAPIRR